MIDYTAYNNHYQYMNCILKSIEQQRFGFRIPTAVQSDFSEVFRSTQQTAVEVPESMDAIFEEAAAKYEVPLKLLKAMAKAESNFDEKAVSSAGAQGVMQLMPETAKSLGVDNPFDARENIMGGAKYISEKLRQYGGDIDLALAAYNAGSGNVRKYGGVPPFRETRNYIKKIKEYMGMDLHADKRVQTAQRRIGAESISANMMTETELGSTLYIMEMMKRKLQLQMEDLSRELI